MTVYEVCVDFFPDATLVAPTQVEAAPTMTPTQERFCEMRVPGACSPFCRNQVGRCNTSWVNSALASFKRDELRIAFKLCFESVNFSLCQISTWAPPPGASFAFRRRLIRYLTRWQRCGRGWRISVETAASSFLRQGQTNPSQIC
jgi:hypothetical protein